MTKTLASLDDALRAISAKGKPSKALLRGLNDLDRDQLAKFAKVFDVLKDDRRALVAELLVNLAEEDYRLGFNAVLRHTLVDSNERVRVLSIEGLWEDESQARIDSLIDLMRNDASDLVRVASVWALERFMYLGEVELIPRGRRDQVYSALMSVLLSASPVTLMYQKALTSISYVVNDEVVRLIREAFTSDIIDLHIAALKAMGRNSEKSFEQLVLDELHHVLPAVRMEAAIACGEMELEEAAPVLGALLDDPDQEVVIAAIEALGNIPGAESQKILSKVAESNDKDLAKLAEDALFEHEIISGVIPLDELFIGTPYADDDEETAEKP